jgi:hypothetical protein
MRKSIIYEWCYETVDENGDIIDLDFADNLMDFSYNQITDTLCLIRREGDDIEGEQDRVYAYVKDGKLPDKFSDVYGHEININVPKKYQKEFKDYCKTHFKNKSI